MHQVLIIQSMKSLKMNNSIHKFKNPHHALFCILTIIFLLMKISNLLEEVRD
jgi:hypothetical protein